MAKIIITGRCGGTVEKLSKLNKPYFITRFSEVPSMSAVDVFGDFKLPASDEVKEYTFEAGIGSLNFPVLQSVNPITPSSKKS